MSEPTGFSGYVTEFSGAFGFSGWVVGFSGYSEFSGYSGVMPDSGYSGFSSDSGWSGFSGESGAKGYSGYSGGSGYSGVSGYSSNSGISGRSGWSGFSAVAGAEGCSGYSGRSGRSGYSGHIGTSGLSGLSGFSGTYSGWSGFSGESGRSGYSAAIAGQAVQYMQAWLTHSGVSAFWDMGSSSSSGAIGVLPSGAAILGIKAFFYSGWEPSGYLHIGDDLDGGSIAFIDVPQDMTFSEFSGLSGFAPQNSDRNIQYVFSAASEPSSGWCSVVMTYVAVPPMPA